MCQMQLIIFTEFLINILLLLKVCIFFFKKHSTVLIIILAFMSFLTATFVIESMACANAITNHRKIQRLKSRISVNQDSSSSDHDPDSTGWAKPRPPFFSWKKLCMLDPIFCVQQVLGLNIRCSTASCNHIIIFRDFLLVILENFARYFSNWIKLKNY